MGTLGHRVSDRFCSTDADITFKSSDGVIFKFYRKNLDVHSEGMAVETAITSPDEVIPLTEDAEILELLFQYMCRQEQPSLDGVKFATLSALAEAAEKYQVYAAIGVLKEKMRKKIWEHPAQILNWAVRHGHRNIANDAAQQCLSKWPSEVYSNLEPDIFHAWLRYYDDWTLAQRQCKNYGLSCAESGPQCVHWKRLAIEIAGKANGHPLTLVWNRVEDAFATPYSCSSCEESIERWRQSVERTMNARPLFETFLS